MLRTLNPLRVKYLCSLFSTHQSTSTLQKSDIEKLRSRLYYQSKKRGILENDIIIGGFADENLKNFSIDQLNFYDKIINGEHMEWDLYYYSTGKKLPPPDLATNPVFLQLREFVKNKETVR